MTAERIRADHTQTNNKMANLETKDDDGSDDAACARILITLEITDPEVVSDYKDACNELVWEDLVNGELINFAGFVSRENDEMRDRRHKTPTKKQNE